MQNFQIPSNNSVFIISLSPVSKSALRKTDFFQNVKRVG